MPKPVALFETKGRPTILLIFMVSKAYTRVFSTAVKGYMRGDFGQPVSVLSLR